MFAKLGRLLVQGYGLLVSVACGGFLGANLAAFAPAINEFFIHPQSRATPPEIYRRWIHGGWLVGAGFAFVASLLEARRRHSGRRPAKRKPDNQSSLQSDHHPRSLPGAAALGAAGGGLLGAMLGGTLLLLWFSLAYSPFSPAEWGSSVTLETNRMIPRSSGSPRGWAVHTTNHPVALYLFLVPTLAGAASGALLAGVGKIVEKIKRRQIPA
jgi:hypothetical protein